MTKNELHWWTEFRRLVRSPARPKLIDLPLAIRAAALTLVNYVDDPDVEQEENIDDLLLRIDGEPRPEIKAQMIKGVAQVLIPFKDRAAALGIETTQIDKKDDELNATGIKVAGGKYRKLTGELVAVAEAPK